MKSIIFFLCLCIFSCGFEEKYDATASPFDSGNPLYDESKIQVTLSASAINGRVTLSWTQVTDLPSSLISGYKIYRTPPREIETEEGEEIIDEGPLASVNKNTTSYDDSNVTLGIEYTYYITYFNDRDESDPSNEVLAIP